MSELAKPCQNHEWLPETRYRFRRCKHCGAHHFEDAAERGSAGLHAEKVRQEALGDAVLRWER